MGDRIMNQQWIDKVSVAFKQINGRILIEEGLKKNLQTGEMCRICIL
jgi:hypothetical protein